MKPSNKTKDFQYQELSELYQAAYAQLVDLKHIIYSSTGLSELKSLSVSLSKHITERMGRGNNAVWLVTGPDRVSETVRNEKIINEDKCRVLEISASEVLSRL